ncbi:MAG: type I 3-dehydroquinate dehydratase [Saprospiraceae bacterium]|nr:type I 3-dehydroquinate dehydratase [Saprospiraceae bacterium]
MSNRIIHGNPIVALNLFNAPSSSGESYDIISAKAVVVRADCFNHIEDVNQIELSNELRILSLKSKREGGQFIGSLQERHRIIINALNQFDLIELEAETDLTPEILNQIVPNKRLISWQGYAQSYEELECKMQKLLTYEARFYQLILNPNSISQGLWPLKIVKNFGRKDIISFASSAVGVWTQILAAFMGSAMIYAVRETDKEDDVFLSLEQLTTDYSIDQTRVIQQIFGIAGNPVFTSMSPLIHNKSYTSLGLEALYLPFQIDDFDEFWRFISVDFEAAELDLTLGGFTMVSPYKEKTFQSASGHLCQPTTVSKACNILINKEGKWYSDSSDGLGVLAALEEIGIDLNGLKVAIIGCGGAGRTIAARISNKNAEIHLFNRSENRGILASKLLNLPFHLIEKFEAENFDIIINATPVGKKGMKLIFDPARMTQNSIAIDMAYAKKDTQLVAHCRKNGKRIIEGKEILLHQVKKQFTGLTGEEMPFEVEMVIREKTENLLKLD